MKASRLSALCTALLASAPLPLLADSPRSGVRTDTLQPASIESPFIRAEGPFASTDDVRFGLGLQFDYAKSPLRFLGIDSAGNVTEVARLVDHSLVGRISLAVAPTKWIRLEAMVPIALFQEGQPAEGQVASYGGIQVRGASPVGLGDPRFGVFVRAYQTRPFNFAVSAHAWAPVGTDTTYLTDKRFRGEIDFHGFGEAANFLYGGSLSISPGMFAGRDGDRLALSLAAHRQIVPIFSIGLEPALVVLLDRVGAEPNVETKPRWILEPLIAARLRPGPMQIALAGGPGFGDAPGTADFRFFLSVAYLGVATRSAPSVAGDSDLDGIPDKADACPDAAGPKSDDPKRNGCPTDDADADGVKDADDQCPGLPGLRGGDPKGRGCPDRDNDGLADPVDECPLEPSFREGGRGCPARARLEKKGFAVTPSADFKGKDAKLSGDALAAIEEMAATLRVNRQIQQLTVVLGTKGAPGKVTDDRAAAIVAAFQRNGVPAARVQVEYSDGQPAGSLRFTLAQ